MWKSSLTVLSGLMLLPLLSACPATKDPQTLQFSTWGSPEEIAILRPLIAEFEAQNPDIHVNVMHIPDKYFQKMHALLAANLAPDVMFLNNIQFPVYASNDAFLDLTPFLQSSTVLQSDDFYPQTLEGFRWKNQIQGIPRDASNLVFFYNKDRFDEVGVPYPTADWTWDTFLATAQKLTQDSNGDGVPEKFGVDAHQKNYFLFWFPYVWSSGGDIFDANRENFTLDEPAALRGLQRFADLRHKYHIAPTRAQAGSLTMSQMFMQGKVAMVLNGCWAMPLYRKEIGFRWDIAPFPKGEAGSVVDADASGWVISKKTHQPEKAWKLVEFLASKKASEAFTKPGLIIPARKDVATSQVFLRPGESPEHANYFLEALNTGKPIPAVPYWNAVLEKVDKALEPVWDGTTTPEEALKGLDKKIKPLL
jgi:multiple sugar transport system substrate-binding protein